MINMGTCQWCTHDWHNGECWCYCLESTTYPEPDYCDRCGVDLSTVDVFVVIEKSQVEFTAFDGFNIEKGDSYAECEGCHSRMGG